MNNFKLANTPSFMVGGLSGVGKTTLLREMQKKSTGQESEATCVGDAVILNWRHGKSNCRNCYVTLYDLAGLPNQVTGRTAIYGHAASTILGAILVFDISDRKSFDCLDQWYKELNVVFPLAETNFVKILVGNKLDKQTLCIPMPEVELWAEKNGFRICLTAAHDGRGVSEILPFLMDISTKIISRREVHPDPLIKTFSATPEQIQSVYRIIYGENDWERLGLPPGSSGALVSKAYRRLAAQIHPDKCPINGSGEAFKLLTASKDALVTSKEKLLVRQAT